jgi:oxalate decarboxylase
MTEFQRREFLAGTAAFAAGVTAVLTATATGRAVAGDPSFMNNVPDPLLSEKELPNFKFALEKSEGRVSGGNTAREASVRELPISKGIAGVSMGLSPGSMRELHWHATAAEWAFVDKGRVRTTVLSPGGYQETNDFDTGDVWYFPRGHGHMLECLGDEPCHFILIFDNG